MTYKKHVKRSSFSTTDQIDNNHLEINKAISAVYAKRENLLRDLKDTNSLLLKLMSQMDLDEEYKKLNRI